MVQGAGPWKVRGCRVVPRAVEARLSPVVDGSCYFVFGMGTGTCLHHADCFGSESIRLEAQPGNRESSRCCATSPDALTI